MSTRVFVDTNVLVYAEDAAAGAKRTRARALIEELTTSGQLVLSTQILQELFNTTTRKLGISAAVARNLVEHYSKLDIVVLRPELILDAIDLHRLHTISFWDALVIRSASAAACSRLLSEDLQHGRMIDGVPDREPIRAADAHGRATGSLQDAVVPSLDESLTAPVASEIHADAGLDDQRVDPHVHLRGADLDVVEHAGSSGVLTWMCSTGRAREHERDELDVEPGVEPLR